MEENAKTQTGKKMITKEDKLKANRIIWYGLD